MKEFQTLATFRVFPLCDRDTDLARIESIRQQKMLELELGCWLSVNAAGMKYAEDISIIPLGRILTETYYSSDDRGSTLSRQPGVAADVETALAQIQNSTATGIRRQAWSTFARLVEDAVVEKLPPRPLERMLALARSETK